MVISVFLIKTDLVSEKKKKKRCSDLNCREILAISTCFKLGPLNSKLQFKLSKKHTKNC